MDRIFIKNLRLRCIIGVNDGERREKQDVVINVSLLADVRQPASTDAFADAVDYRAINKRIIAYVEGSEHFLVEALASRIAEICLEDPRVLQARVGVEKPGALRFADSVGVEVVRERKG